MGIIIRSYTMTDGNTLVPSSLNGDIHSTTAFRGICSEPNGRLQTGNFAPSFEIQRQHIYPGEAVKAIEGNTSAKLDYVDKMCGTDSGFIAWIPLAGVAARIFLPYACSVVLYEWQFFYSVWRQPKVLLSGVNPPSIKTKPFIDGYPLDYAAMGTPWTVDGNADPNITDVHEHLMSECRAGSHLGLDVAAGWHEIAVHLWMEPQDGAQSLADLLTGMGAIAVSYNHRLTTGFRAARIIPFL